MPPSPLIELERIEPLGEDRFRWLAEMVDHHVWITDSDGRSRYFNAQVAAYFGPSVDVGDPLAWAEAIHPDDARHAMAVVAHGRATGDADEFTARLRRHDGAYRDFHARSFPGLNADGGVERWYGVART